jgi:hypothetical protein
MEEIFKDIPNYEGMYQVSNFGRVKSLKFGKERILKPATGKRNYLECVLSNKKTKTVTVHQLVVITFLGHVPCGLKLVVNHKNFVRTDNRLNNLEIITVRENTNLKHINSSSKYTGVHWSKKNKKWHAQIYINNKVKYLGCFTDEIKASEAYPIKTIIMKTLNFLIDMFEAVPESQQNALAIIKLRHLKQELQELEKNNSNDMELGAEIRKLLKQ